jgi:hypothetical protein
MCIRHGSFYHSTARFVGWLVQLDAPGIWLGSAQKLDQPDTWTASNLVALGHTQKMLLQEFNCVEGVQDHPADAAAGDDADARTSSIPSICMTIGFSLKVRVQSKEL